MLAECDIAPATLLLTLNESTNRPYYYIPSIGCKRIRMFTRFPEKSIPVILENDRLTIKHLNIQGKVDILLSVSHLPSKLYWKNPDQIIAGGDLSKSIKKAEGIIGHTRTVLVGDLNMNPFEDGVIMASGLNGTMSRSVVALFNVVRNVI